VKMYGDDMTAEIPEDQKKYSFSHQPVLPRIAVVLAGPLMNAVFALALFTAIAGIGEETLRPRVGDVASDSAAYAAGFRPGDFIKSVNGQTMDSWDDVKKAVEDDKSKPMSFTIERDGKDAQITVTPAVVANKNVLSDEAQIGDIDGLNYLTRASAVGISDPSSAVAQAGLKTGDIIRKFDGKDITKWTELVAMFNEAAKRGKSTVNVEVERDGDEQKFIPLTLPVDAKKPLASIEPSDLYLASIVSKSAADAAGIQAGDRLISINGKPLERWEDVVHIVQSYKQGQPPFKVVIRRSGRDITTDVTPKLMTQTDGTGAEVQNFALGIVTGLVYSPPETFIYKIHSPVLMFQRGFEETAHWTKLTALSFVKLAQGKVSSKSIGGPLMIGKLASDTWRIGLSAFLKIMSIISINLFLLNLLPIPVLDGGHLLFFSIEFVKGSPLSFRKIEVMQQVGMFLLLALMVFSMFNDIVRLFSS
jgi:regulator of sigma E protease